SEPGTASAASVAPEKKAASADKLEKAEDSRTLVADDSATLTRSGGSLPPRSDTDGTPRVRRIRANANGDTTRVTIDLEDSVMYSSGHIVNPERIFFDLHAARLSAEVARGNIKVEGDLLTGVRVAQNQAGVVRVVLDVNGVKDYTASLTNNPPQLIIDLYAKPPSPVKT